jgi:hypothetical protein
MARLSFSQVLSAVLLPFATLCLGACSGDPQTEQASARSGTLSVPLVTETNGNLYRLNAAIYISGPTTTYLTTTENPAETTVSATLPTGTYYVSLQYWTLERRDSDGVFRPVRAELISSASATFAIFNGTTSTISYQFRTDGVIVTVGQGNLNVTVDVSETSLACTPFGNDCAESTWCAPTELMGAAPACIAAGSVAVGQHCTDVTSCVANASCFDLGSGPVCVALCASSNFDQPCAGGGTCQAVAAATYGLCR